jgi:hypothetical protein
MAVLQPSEYDASYFEGGEQTYAHNAGYTHYHRVQYNQRGMYAPTVPIEESTGNVYGDLCKVFNIKLNARFVGKKLLVIGCAYGFEVKAFRDLGVNAWGIDVSAFAISQAESSIQPYLQVGDIRTAILSMGRNSYDYIFSRWFLECMSDTDLAALIPELNRVNKSGQVHNINTDMRTDYYNTKTLAQWLALGWEQGTILVANNDFDNYVVK